MLVMAVKRRELDITQEELAAKLEVSQVEISYYERGIVKPPKENLGKLAEVLGVEPDEVQMEIEQYVLRQHGLEYDRE